MTCITTVTGNGPIPKRLKSRLQTIGFTVTEEFINEDTNSDGPKTLRITGKRAGTLGRRQFVEIIEEYDRIVIQYPEWGATFKAGSDSVFVKTYEGDLLAYVEMLDSSNERRPNYLSFPFEEFIELIDETKELRFYMAMHVLIKDMSTHYLSHSEAVDELGWEWQLLGQPV